MARRGVAIRQTTPRRARAILDALAPWPFYKGGQFLFDLMEWEDMMIDGEPPPVLSHAELTGLPVDGITGGTYTGTAASWQRQAVPDGVSFIVELGPTVSDEEAGRHAAAVLQLASELPSI